jgi:carotenoid cleavage dioxygenase-like enzyme
VSAFKNVHGFYGLIGPDIQIHNKTTLYELFTGDGMVQGVFIENGQLTLMNHLVRTDKLIYESENGRIPENMFIRMLFMFFGIMKMLPNVLGLANTSLFNMNNKILALYERDVPYLLNLDFENKSIQTVKKLDNPSLKSFSAHSKFSESRGIQTLDYNVLKREVNYLEMNEDMECLHKTSVKMKYIPVVHDFFCTNSSVVLMDAPIVLDFLSIFENKLPVRFDTSQKTIFRVLRYNDSTVEKYVANDAFYAFHYATGTENKDRIELFASIYENMDFNDLNIHGKYRKIILHKSNMSISMEKNPVLETMNLDFPIHYGTKIVLRNIENNLIQEFVVCRGLQIIKRIKFKKRFICGEPSIVEGTPFMACFANDINEDKSYLIFVNLDSYETIEIPTGLPRYTVGFHGLFVKQ